MTENSLADRATAARPEQPPPNADATAGWVSLISSLALGEATFPKASMSTSKLLYQFELQSALLPLTHSTPDAAKRDANSKLKEAFAIRSKGVSNGVVDLMLAAAILDPASVKHWEAIAVEAFGNEQLGLADAASLKALQLNPQHGPYHALRAEILIEKRQVDLAMVHLLLAIELGSPEPASATDVIERCYARCQKIWPGMDWSFSELAGVLVSRGHREKAVASFVRGIWRSRPEPLTRTLVDLCCAGSPLAGARQTRVLDLPIVLVSQIQRSGGTLLAQLFDGHTKMLVHPHEIQIGRPQKWDWPKLDLAQSPRDWLQALFESSVTVFLSKGGYAKGDENTYALKDRKPFIFSLDTLCKEFLRLSADARSQRQVINAYLTAYFLAWRNHKSTGRERLFAGFCPRLILFEDSVARFFADYPDGHLVSCIRNPVSWFASSSRHDREYASVVKALRLWTKSTLAALALARARPKQVHLLTYDALVTDTRGVMTRLAKRLRVPFEESLLTPTYLSEPILPNSSFSTNEYGVHRRSLDQRDLLSKSDLETINRKALPLYNKALNRIASS